MQTGRAITNNKLDIIIRGSEIGTCLLIDVSVSRGRNVIKEDAEKNKYLKVEIHCMWNVKKKLYQ